MKQIITSFTVCILLFTNACQLLGYGDIFLHAMEAGRLEKLAENNGGENAESSTRELFTLRDLLLPPLVLEAGTMKSPAEILAKINIDLRGGKLSSLDLSRVDFGVPGEYEASVTLHIPILGNQHIIIPIHIIDDIPPIITGQVMVSYDVGAIVSEAQFLQDTLIKVTDNVSSPIMPTVDLSQVDFNTKGIYQVIVRATDASSNEALPFLVVVNIGGLELRATVQVEAGFVRTIDEILAASDLDLSGLDLEQEFDLSDVDFNTPGEYEVTIDAKGPLSTISIVITVRVIDTVPPILIGSPVISYKVGASVSPAQFLTDIHLVVRDNASGEEDIVPRVDFTGVDFNTKGIYQVIVQATDASGNTSLPFPVNIRITDGSLLTLSGLIEVEAGEMLTAHEIIVASGIDLLSFRLASELDLTHVDFTTPGCYEATTVALDIYGIQVAYVVIKINVRDTKPPVITGDDAISYVIGTDVSREQLLADANIHVNDNVGSEDYIVPSVDLSRVDFTTLGTYEAEIVASDASGNTTRFIVLVHILRDETIPIISGADEITYIRGIVPSEAEFITDLNIQAHDNSGTLITPQADLSHINFNDLGLYVGVIEATDSRGKQAEKFYVIVHIVPVPEDLITARHDVTYEAGTKVDNIQFIRDANIKVLSLHGVMQTPVFTLDNIDFSRVGVYPVEVLVQSRAGAVLASITINVHIFDEKPPVITADRKVTYIVGSLPTEAEFISDAHIDVQDNSGEAEILIDLSYINFERVGPYVATINAQDTAGNKAAPFHVFVFIVDASVE